MNWEVTTDKIISMTKNIIEQTRKRCEEIINSQKKDVDILKVFLNYLVLAS